MGSQGGGAINQRTLADGAVVNLAKKIRPFIIGDGMDLDCRNWGTEGLAYLSLDAGVKEMIVGDWKILRNVSSLCADGGPSVQYGLPNVKKLRFIRTGGLIMRARLKKSGRLL